MNAIQREIRNIEEAISSYQSKLNSLTRNRDLLEQIEQECTMRMLCTFSDSVTVWVERTDLPKARDMLGRLVVSNKVASDATKISVFLKCEDHPEIRLAYCRPAPDHAYSRCKIVTEERVEKKVYHSLVCPGK